MKRAVLILSNHPYGETSTVKSKFALISMFVLAFSGTAIGQDLPSTSFQAMDKDGNGNLNDKELKKHPDYEKLSAQMDTLDKDKDGFLNDDEFSGFETGATQPVEDAGSSMGTRSPVTKPGN
jgi:hypothetical protein